MSDSVASERKMVSRSRSESTSEGHHTDDTTDGTAEGNIQTDSVGYPKDTPPAHPHSSQVVPKSGGKPSLRMRFSKSFSSFDKDSSKKPSVPSRFISVLAHFLTRKGHNSSSEGQSHPEANHQASSSGVEEEDPSRGYPRDMVEPEMPYLDQQEMRCLRETWAIIKHDISNVGIETFMGLFNTHPESLDSFLAFKDYNINDIEKSTILKAHSLRVMQTVDKCISRLEEPDKMAAVLESLGTRHVGYRAKRDWIPIIGKQFVAAIEPKMAERWNDETRACWEHLFDVINAHIKHGMICQEDQAGGHLGVDSSTQIRKSSLRK